VQSLHRVHVAALSWFYLSSLVDIGLAVLLCFSNLQHCCVGHAACAQRLCMTHAAAASCTAQARNF
jgi:hypothetical protein